MLNYCTYIHIHIYGILVRVFHPPSIGKAAPVFSNAPPTIIGFCKWYRSVKRGLTWLSNNSGREPPSSIEITY